MMMVYNCTSTHTNKHMYTHIFPHKKSLVQVWYVSVFLQYTHRKSLLLFQIKIVWYDERVCIIYTQKESVTFSNQNSLV